MTDVLVHLSDTGSGGPATERHNHYVGDKCWLHKGPLQHSRQLRVPSLRAYPEGTVPIPHAHPDTQHFN